MSECVRVCMVVVVAGGGEEGMGKTCWPILCSSCSTLSYCTPSGNRWRAAIHSAWSPPAARNTNGSALKWAKVSLFLVLSVPSSTSLDSSPLLCVAQSYVRMWLAVYSVMGKNEVEFSVL